MNYAEAIEPEETEVEQQQSPTDWLMQALQSKNIADLLDDQQLANIGQKVLKELEIDKGSRSEWDKTMRDAMDLAMQVAKDKTFPWPNAANVKYPLLTVAAIQFNARAYPAIVPGKDIVKCKVNGDDSGIMDAVIGPDGQPVMTPEGIPQMQVVVPPGSKQARATRVGHHMSWQLSEEMEEWEEDTDRLLTVLPITGTVFRKSYFDSGAGKNCSQMVLPNKIHVDYKAQSLDRAPRVTHEFGLYPYQIQERIRSGIFIDFNYDAKGEDEDAEQIFYEQHRRLDLDEDGYSEPYIVTINEEGKVCRIVARFDQDGVQLNQSGEIAMIKPIQYFTKYGFMPNPESAIYDLGFGMLLNPINETVNTILNQMLDAGTLQNAGGGFIGKGLRIKGGVVKQQPGVFHRIDSSGGAIRDNIYHMQHPGPSPVLFQLLGLLIEAGKEIASVKDVLTGDSRGANASPTTTIAMIEQGLKTFTAIFKRVHRSLKAELKKLYDLNRKYLDQEVYFTLLDDQEAVFLEDYQADDYDITPVSDPSVVTDMQKMAKMQALMQFNGDPYFNQMELRTRYLTQIGIDDLDKLLEEPKPQEDPKVKLDAMKLELEAMKVKGKLPVELAEIMSKTIKNLADAEAAEAGIQLDSYMALAEAISNEYERRGISSMEESTGNKEVPPVSQGSGAGPTG